MTSSNSAFSTAEHTLRLDGYLDAVGRSLSSDAELYALCARTVADDAAAEDILGVPIADRLLIENWSSEFGSLVDGLLGMNQRARLGFYLIDSLCWFKEFTADAKCFKLKCAALDSGVVEQAAYLLDLERSQRVLILAVRSVKTHNNSLKSDAAKPRTLG